MKVLAVGSPKEVVWYGSCVFCRSIIAANSAELGGQVLVDRKGPEVIMTVVKSCPECKTLDAVCFHPADHPNGIAIKKQFDNRDIPGSWVPGVQIGS